MRRITTIVFVFTIAVASCTQTSDDGTTTRVSTAASDTTHTEGSTPPATGGGVWSNPNALTALAVGPDGTIWAAGLGGVTAWDPSSGDHRVFTIADGLGANLVRDVAVDAAGHVAVAHGYPYAEDTWLVDVSVLDGGVWTSYDLSGDYPYTGQWSVDLDPSGQLRAVSDAGVYRYGNGAWEQTTEDPDLVPVATVTDDDGRLWMAFWDVALIRLPAGAVPSEEAINDEDVEMHAVAQYLSEYEPAVDAGAIAALHLVPGLEYVVGAAVTDSRIWALGGPGTASWDGEQWTRVDAPELFDVDVVDVVASDGVTWLATGEGLIRLADAGVERWLVPGSVGSTAAHLVPYGGGVAGIFFDAEYGGAPDSFQVAALAGDEATILLTTAYDQNTDAGGGAVVPNVVVDADGRLLGIDDRGDLIDVVSGDLVAETEPYPRSINELMVDGDGGIWADVVDALWYLEGEAWVEVVSYGYMADPRWWIRETEADASGSGAWLGAWDSNASETALYFVTPDGTVTEVESPPLHSIGAMTVDGTGVLMASFNSFSDDGVIVAGYDGSAWEAWRLADAPDAITVLSRTSDGTIWAGTGHPDPSVSSGRGLVAIRGDQWGLVTTGIPSPDIIAITSTGPDELWVGSAGGVALVDPGAVTFSETGEVVAETSTGSATTTVPTSTTTTTAATTTSTSVPRQFEVGVPEYQVPALSGSDGYYGSGCAPGTDTLPDGIWFGGIERASETLIEFDLMCFGPPDAASPGAGKITNSNPKLRQVPVDASALVYAIADDGGWQLVPYPAWYVDPGHDTFCPPEGCWSVWLYVNDGAVTEIVQLWFT